jgi:hypothetical protein
MRALLFIIAGAPFLLPAQQLSIRPSGNEIQLSWPRVFPTSSGVPTVIDSRIFSSGDLQNWVEETTLTLDSSAGNGVSAHNIAQDGTPRFFRLEEFLTYTHRSDPSDPPAFYQQQFLNAMEGFGSAPTPDESGCLPRIDWDPIQANFWAEFNTTPEEHNADLANDDPERRRTDFSPNEAERAKFVQNRFVVSPRIDLMSEIQFGGPQLLPITTSSYGQMICRCSFHLILYWMPGTRLF